MPFSTEIVIFAHVFGEIFCMCLKLNLKNIQVMKKSIIATGAAALLFFVGACCGCRSSKTPAHTLTSDSWQLVELGGGEKLASTDDDSYTITFDAAENRLFGCGDCNLVISVPIRRLTPVFWRCRLWDLPG